MIAVDQRAGIDQHHIALTQHVVLRQAMWKGGRAAKLHRAESIAGRGPQRAVGRVDEADDLRRPNPLVQDMRGAAMHLQRHLHRLAH